MTIDELFCRWAEDRYGYPAGSVVEVTFEDEYDEGYGEYTPGIGAITAVYIKRSGRKLAYAGGETETADLIRDIAQFSLTVDR